MTLVISSSFSLSFLSDDNDPWHIIEKDVLVSAIYFIQRAGPVGGGGFSKVGHYGQYYCGHTEMFL